MLRRQAWMHARAILYAATWSNQALVRRRSAKGITMRALTLPVLLALAACQHNQPGVEVRVVEKLVEVQKPCPGIPPERPEPLGSLPQHAATALAHVLAKLAEYSAPGQFADKAEAYVAACPPSD